jgi:mitochondrial fission protein ELM1
VLTLGHAGFESQAIGLAEAIGGEIVVKRAAPRFPWGMIPPCILLPPLNAITPGSDALAPPWPDMIISCGRRVAALALAVKRASGGKVKAVHVQDPPSPAAFDLVAAPAHDRLSGPNVIVTDGALHRVTPEKLALAATEFSGLVASLPRPLVAVLIGGSNRRYRMTENSVRRLCAGLEGLARSHGAGFCVTASRRTGEANAAILKACLANLPAQIWDGTGPNPYLGYLALADAIIVTSDSVSMTSEAVSTGKPVYVFDLEGGSDRFRRFHARLNALGMTRPFEGRMSRWRYAPPDDTRRTASAARALIVG